MNRRAESQAKKDHERSMEMQANLERRALEDEEGEITFGTDSEVDKNLRI